MLMVSTIKNIRKYVFPLYSAVIFLTFLLLDNELFLNSNIEDKHIHTAQMREESGRKRDLCHSLLTHILREDVAHRYLWAPNTSWNPRGDPSNPFLAFEKI